MNLPRLTVLVTLLTVGCSDGGDDLPSRHDAGSGTHDQDSGVPSEDAGREEDAGSGTDAGSLGDAGAGTDAGNAPDVWFDFAEAGDWDVIKQDDGVVAFAAAADGSLDSKVCQLTIAGHPELMSTDRVSPSYASEIDSAAKYSYGRYVVRVRFATCSAAEEAVSGIFTYQNDGMDHDKDGLVDNHEIDIEHLCSHPETLWLTTWTDYTDDTHMWKRTRAVNLHTGEVLETPDGKENGYDLEANGTLPADVRIASFPDAGMFYEVGFDWTAERLRWFIISDGKELTLWDLKQKDVIAQAPAPMLFNLWHPNTQWSTGDAADYPANDTTFAIDDFKIWLH